MTKLLLTEPYKDIWHPLVGDDSLICERKENNGYENNAVEIVFDDFLLKEIVGHVPLPWSELASKLLQFPNHPNTVIVTGKRANRDAGFGLETHLDYVFYGDNKVITWIKKVLEKLGWTV